MHDAVSNLFAFVIGLGFLIFVHETGHFAVAKLFRVRVLVYSFGFGKRLFGFRRGDTDYRVSLVPLGGYVRMAGDTPDDNQPGNPDEFLSRPKWQRFLILFAGPFMNLVIAVGFLAIIAMVGTESVVMEPVIGYVQPGKPAAKAGLQFGDRIVELNGETIREFDDLKMTITMHAGTPLKVVYLRHGRRMQTTLTPERENSEYGPIGRAGIMPYVPAVAGRVRAGSAAEQGGLRAGDRIVSANGKPVTQLADFDTALDAARQKPIGIEVLRGTQRVPLTIGPVPDEEKDPYRGFIPPTRVRKLGFAAALQDSVHENWRMLKFAMTALGRMFRAEGSVKELSGPISIARISGDMFRRGWMNFIALLAMISLQLGIMNLLPIPVLDGGHIMILLIEGVARRDLSIRVKERVQQLGFAVLATLMIVVLYNDVITNVMRR